MRPPAAASAASGTLIASGTGSSASGHPYGGAGGTGSNSGSGGGRPGAQICSGGNSSVPTTPRPVELSPLVSGQRHGFRVSPVVPGGGPRSRDRVSEQRCRLQHPVAPSPVVAGGAGQAGVNGGAGEAASINSRNNDSVANGTVDQRCGATGAVGGAATINVSGVPEAPPWARRFHRAAMPVRETPTAASAAPVEPPP